MCVRVYMRVCMCMCTVHVRVCVRVYMHVTVCVCVRVYMCEGVHV